MIQTKLLYERFRPLIVWLGIVELAWIGHWLLSGNNPSGIYVAIAFAWIGAMLGWLGLVIFASSRGFFLKYTRQFSNLVAVLLVVAFAVSVFTIIPVARDGMLDAARNTSDVQLISIHILRLLAIGTIIKYFHRELPLHFVLLGSIPDFVFALSAVVFANLAVSGPINNQLLFSWHTVGFLVFLGPGISMFFSVPSPARIFYTRPDTSIVFQFPMALAPALTVPLFMIAHLFALAKLTSI